MGYLPISRNAKDELVRSLLSTPAMETTYGSVVRDGDEQLVIVPENKTVEFYNYLRGYGFSFTIDCRGFLRGQYLLLPRHRKSRPSQNHRRSLRPQLTPIAPIPPPSPRISVTPPARSPEASL
jgi:hypothetical protein